MPEKKPLAGQVKDAIQRGSGYLKSHQANGNWEKLDPSTKIEGGISALVLFALLEAGVKADDPAIVDGLRYLRTIEPHWTYLTSLQTMVFARSGKAEDRQRIQRNADWLVARHLVQNGKFAGWTYGDNDGAVADNSNTHYAVMGLDAAVQAGARVRRQVWQDIRDYYVKTRQHKGWCYVPNVPTGASPSLTMTCAGVSGLKIAAGHLEDRSSEVARAIDEGVEFVADHWQFPAGDQLYFFAYDVAQAGRLMKKKAFTSRENPAGHDWYREGAELLLQKQSPDGAWSTGHNFTAVNTSFALLFLSAGQ
jgi:hypothetical protein